MDQNEETPKQPKKRGRFWGMKSRNTQKGIKKKRKKPNSAKKDLSDYQDKTRKDFLKRMAGESQEEWEDRTKRRRVFGVSGHNKIKIARNGQMKAYKRPLKGKAKEIKLTVSTRFLERPFEYLQCYAFIMRWAAIRHDVLKDDIELGYFFDH